LLGYAPKTTLREGIQQAVEWSVRWWESHPK
jgi:nucleoside-diphosphate-sugar epimerase